MTSLRRHYPDQVQGSRQQPPLSQYYAAPPALFIILLSLYKYIVNCDRSKNEGMDSYYIFFIRQDLQDKVDFFRVFR